MSPSKSFGSVNEIPRTGVALYLKSLMGTETLNLFKVFRADAGFELFEGRLFVIRQGRTVLRKSSVQKHRSLYHRCFL